MENNGLKISPTLIVGIGGTGSLGLQYAKRKIREQLRRYAPDKDVPKKIPFIEYLVLDTTSQEDFIEQLPGDEYLNLGHINVSRLINYIDKSSFRETLEWFPPQINPGQIDSGARGVRHIGRLCFFDKMRIIESRLRHKVQSITDYAAVNKVLKEQFNYLSMEPASTVDVHLISSLCGGTGSACLLDAAYLIKDIIEEVLKQGANSTAHLVTTEPFVGDSSINATSREYIRYNFAISLAEIERFMNFNVNLSDTKSEGKGWWEVKYLDGRVVSSIEKPFSVTYLLGYKEGETISKKTICETIGDTIALKTVHRENRWLKGLIDNVKAHVINQQDETGKIRAYSSYNTRILSAEFSEQIVEASTFLASGTILDAICKSSVPHDLDAMVDDLRRATHHQTEDNGLEFELSKEEFAGMYARVDKLLDITEERFNETEIKIRRATDSKRWFGLKQGRAIEEKIYRANERYALEKETCLETSLKIASDFKEWLQMVKRIIPGNVLKSLEEGHNLAAVTKSLERLSGEIDNILYDLALRRKPLSSVEIRDGSWIGSAIQKNEYSRSAVSLLRSDILIPLYGTFETGLREVKGQVRTIIEKCENAAACLIQTRELVKEKSSTSYSFTESSLWTRENVGRQIEKRSKMLVKTFIKQLNLQSSTDDKDIDGRIIFLWYLDPNEPKRSKEVESILRTVARDVVMNEIQIEQIDFNDSNNNHAVIGDEELHRFVELAAPTWQIERAGEDIAEVSITNCPKETRLGRIIANLGKGISFSENSPNARQIIVFRSEHGISADRLLNIGICMDALRQKLKVEDKNHINDLSLNPEWGIDEPGATRKIEHLLTLFSLASMFGRIGNSFGAYYFLDSSDNQVILSSNADPTRKAERCAAFGKFLTLLAKHDKQAETLIQQIERQWEMKRERAIEDFKQEVSKHIELLEAIKDHELSSSNGELSGDVAQFEREITVLQSRVLEPIERFIESERLVKKEWVKHKASAEP